MSQIDPPATNPEQRKANQASELEKAVRMFQAGRATGLQRLYDSQSSAYTPGTTNVELYGTGYNLEVTEASLAVMFMQAEVYMNTANSPIEIQVEFGGGTYNYKETVLYVGNLVPTDSWESVSTPGTELVSGAVIYPTSPICVGLNEDTYDMDVWGRNLAGAADTSIRNLRLWVVVL